MFEVSGDGFGYWVQRVGMALTRSKVIPRFADAVALASQLNNETQPKGASMNNKWFLILGALLGTAEETVPIFIHNANSQRIEGVVVTAGNQLFTTLATILAGPSQAQVAAQTAATPPTA
jgi:hypothetical protein